MLTYLKSFSSFKIQISNIRYKDLPAVSNQGLSNSWFLKNQRMTKMKKGMKMEMMIN
jgi:hypothetical protein